jgi:hypothetical protein
MGHWGGNYEVNDDIIEVYTALNRANRGEQYRGKLPQSLQENK